MPLIEWHKSIIKTEHEYVKIILEDGMDAYNDFIHPINESWLVVRTYDKGLLVDEKIY